MFKQNHSFLKVYLRVLLLCMFNYDIGKMVRCKKKLGDPSPKAQRSGFCRVHGAADRCGFAIKTNTALNNERYRWCS